VPPSLLGTVRVGPAEIEKATPLGFKSSSYTVVSKLALARPPRDPLAAAPAAPTGKYEVLEASGAMSNSLPMILLFSFLGGLILNLIALRPAGHWP